MKPITALFFLLGICATIAWGQRPPPRTVATAVIPSQPSADLQNTSVTFLTAANGAPTQNLGAGQGLLDLGNISYFSKGSGSGTEVQSQKNAFTVSTRFAVRIGEINRHRAGTVNVSAVLVNPNVLRTVRLDGIRLSAAPQIIARRVSYGTVTEHLLQITIPTSDPAGPLSDAVSVIVTPN